MGNHLKALFLLYVRPFKAISLILDRGRLGWALVFGIVAGLLDSAPRLDVDYPPGVSPPPYILQVVSLMTYSGAIRSVAELLIVVAAIFVPAAVIVMNKLEGTGSAGVVLPRDYMPMLVCHLMALSAALLPVAAAAWLAPGIVESGVSVAALLFFAFLSVSIVRTLSGTGFGRAVATVASSFAVSVGADYLYSFVSGALYFLASPFVLYYLYIMFGQGISSELRGFGGGLSARQRMRQLLETSTVNPRDADARYQLGLIYQQRRDFEHARKCFEEAVAIDPKEAEPQYQLGRVLRAQGHPEAALEHLKSAAAIDSKTAQSEVLRETGAVLLELGRDAEARDVLREFTNRRSFDPEGWYWLGVALARLRDAAGARQALEQSIESVRTAPKHLRRQVGRWESAASKQLRQLT